MKTIYKYPFSVTDEFSLTLPVGARVLCVQTQNDLPCLWAIVDPDAAKEERTFFVRGTGHPLGDVGRYIGTFQMRGGSLVFHVFEGKEL